MALTTERSLEIRGEKPAIEATTLQAALTLLQGSLSMSVAGEVRKVTTGVAGSVLLGAAAKTYDAAVATTWTSPQMTFRRGVMAVTGLTGALPTQANIGTMVRLVDENTISNAAIGGNDLSVKLIAIDGSDYWVEV